MDVKKRLSMREASGAVSLVILILFVQTVIFIVQPEAVKEQAAIQEQVAIEEQTTIKEENSRSINKGSIERGSTYVSPDIKDNKQRKQREIQLDVSLFSFDPNSATQEEFEKLGLTHKQAQVIVKYREKGGVFKTKEELKKIYVLPDGFYDRVKDSIYIGTLENSHNSKIANVLPEKISIELNQADSSSLLELPGIGPYYAMRIIEYRKKIGGFVCSEQLLEIKGIDTSRFSLFAHMVFADTLKIVKKDLNKATLNELTSNPYIGLYAARSIVRFREIVGKEGITLATLVLNKVLSPDVLKNLRHYFN